MKLFARTPGDDGLVLNVILTGQVQEDNDGIIWRVEIVLPIGCDHVVGYTIESLPKSPMGQQLLWVNPGALCVDVAGGVNPAKQDQIRAEVVRVNDQRRLDMARGPLGENWP